MEYDYDDEQKTNLSKVFEVLDEYDYATAALEEMIAETVSEMQFSDVYYVYQ